MKTSIAEPVFADTNILMYMALTSSPFHTQAVARVAALRSAGHELWISRQTLREYLAGMTRPGLLTGTVPVPALLMNVQAFVATYRVAEDGPAVTAELLAILGIVPAAGKQIHDANIVATMRAHRIPRLLTNNVMHFTRFAAFITVEPLVP